MKAVSAVSLAAAAVVAACGGDSGSGTPPPAQGGGPTTGTITLRGAGPFGPHTGQTLRAALVRTSDSATLDIQKGTVAATDPAFLVTFAPTVDLTAGHQVRYWVDTTNLGVCDDFSADHQWQVDVPSGAGLVAVTHNTSFTNTCGTFTFLLTFRGQGPFGPHDGERVGAALVRDSDGVALEPVLLGTVVTSNPAFSFPFTSRVFIGEGYSVKLWVDEDGSLACTAPPADHQWSVPVATGLASHPATQTYVHTAAFTDVCAYFP